jgi:hypothetical protein
VFRKHGFAAERINRSSFESVHDVHLPEAPMLKIDAKYRVGGWAHHSVFIEQVLQYAKEPYDIPVMVTKAGKQQNDELACLRLEDFAFLMGRLYLGGGDGMCCPQCRSVVQSSGSVLNADSYTCQQCRYQFIGKRC